MQKYYYDVENKVLRTSSGADASINDSMQPNFTLGQKDLLNIQLVSDSDNTKYDKLTATMTAKFLADSDYENPGIPLSMGNSGWVNSSGSEYYLTLATAPTSVAFDGTDATLGTIGSLTAEQYGYNATTLRLYVRLADSAAPSSKSADFITVTYVNASATPLAIEASADVFNLDSTWLDEVTGLYRDPVIEDGEITFRFNANTPNFYNKLGSTERVTGFAEIPFFLPVGDDVEFKFKIKFDKAYFQNRLLTSGENPLELVGVDVYTKAEVIALNNQKADKTGSSDIEITDATKGLILKDQADGTRWRIVVNNGRIDIEPLT